MTGYSNVGISQADAHTTLLRRSPGYPAKSQYGRLQRRIAQWGTPIQEARFDSGFKYTTYSGSHLVTGYLFMRGGRPVRMDVDIDRSTKMSCAIEGGRFYPDRKLPRTARTALRRAAMKDSLVAQVKRLIPLFR